MNLQPILKELAKLGVITLTQETVKHYVDTKIKPIFENWGKDENRSIELEDCLSEYLLKCYAKNIIMNTIVFGRLKKSLDDLYIPLTLEEYRNEDKKWVIDETCYDILEAYDKILIIDKAGMGKSTIVKYFACQGINLDKCIPIVVELRKLDTNQSILEFIKKQLSSFDKNIKIEDIVRMLNKGEFVIFFDGYDEVPNDYKSFILDQIQEFISNARTTKVVLTSREENDLNSLGEFKCVNIKPLTKKEAYNLIKKYDNYGEVSEKLIKRLNEDSSMNVLREFLTNPLLVSLLYKTFEYKEEIPYKKIDFYDQVYIALFNDHDKTKGSAYVHEKKTKLDKFQFEKVLRAFGFLTLKTGKVEYSSQMIYQLLEQSINRFGWLKISTDDFLDDITLAVPFIQQEGNEYKWVHKSFMEYFASCFICYDNKEFEKVYFEKLAFKDFDHNYGNILEFCYDIDTLSFRKYVILPYVIRYINKYDQYFKQEYFDDYDEKYLEKAKGLLAVCNDLTFSIYSNDNGEKDEESLIKNKDMIAYIPVEKNQHIFLTGNSMYYGLYRIIEEKLPELFDAIDIKGGIKSEIIDNFQLDEQYIFEDDRNNFICARKDIFYHVLDIFFSFLYYEASILNYDKCKELIKEIEAESNNYNSSLFEL